MDPRLLQRQIEDLRSARVRTPPDTSMAGDFTSMSRALAEQVKRRAGVGDLWLAHCPPELLEKCAVDSLSRGVLTIRAQDAATRYLLDRALGAGLLQRLTAASTAPIRRVRVVTGAASRD